MKNKFSKSNIYNRSVNIIKILISLACCLFALLFIGDIFTTPHEIEFPWESGGFFYTSVEIYILRGTIVAIINMLPLIFIIFKRLRDRINFVLLIVILFDIIYLIGVMIYYR